MTQLATTHTLPKVADLFAENIEQAFKQEELNLLLNQEPNAKWVKEHPFIKGYRYLPIDKIEFMLRKIFKVFRIEITGQGTAFNGVWVTVRVHYLNPTTGEMSFHDGIGAMQLQTAKGTSPADLININNGALSMAFPAAKTVAIKDACDHFGKLFGCDLNRKDTLNFTFDASLSVTKTGELPQSIIDDVERITDAQFLSEYWENSKELHKSQEFIKLVTKQQNKIKNGTA